MRAHPANTVVRSRAASPRAIRFIARTLAVSGSLLVMGMLIGACDGASPSAPKAFAAGAPNASMSEDADRNGPQGDSAAIRAVAATWDAAWNAANSAGIAATFTDDGELINGRGGVTSGAAAIRAQHAANLAGPFLGSRSKGTVRRITFLSGTTAVLDVDNELTGFKSLPGGTKPTEPGLNRGRHKRVLVKRAGEWRTVLMQITFVAPAAPTP
jgi:uncharacterized protein (TIGR02246 family)